MRFFPRSLPGYLWVPGRFVSMPSHVHPKLMRTPIES